MIGRRENAWWLNRNWPARIALWVACVACVAEAAPSCFAQETAGGDSRGADRKAIGALHDAFIKAFEARDAEALSGYWTAEGVYENERGVGVQGREALAKVFGAFFDKTPEIKAEMRADSITFVGKDLAMAEGKVVVRRGPVQPATRARYSALLAREEGKWRLAKMTETVADEPNLDDLAWLIGEWASVKGEGAEIRTTYAWSPNKKFIYVDFVLKEKNLTLAGKQMIGIDPATGQLRSWTFEADGGVGTGSWRRDGDHWVIEVDGHLADGRTLTETNVLRRVGDDATTWQSVERELDGAAFPDLPPVKISRVKSAK